VASRPHAIHWGVSTLLVIRHGQASFGTPDYDRLTELGVEQARLLGEHLGRERLKIDTMWVGPRLRQRDTARHMLAAGRAAGMAWPDPEEVAALDEYPAEAIVRRTLPRLIASDDDARALFGGDPMGAPTDARRFQRLFERIMRSWAAGELALDGTETFAEFRIRVTRALRAILAAAGRGRTVAVVTSAGPLSIAAQMALELSDAVALKSSWIVANTGLCDIRFRDDEMTLVAFNALPHLPDRRLVTYR
jgi:broad specificity phosphatase PhoE